LGGNNDKQAVKHPHYKYPVSFCQRKSAVISRPVNVTSSWWKQVLFGGNYDEWGLWACVWGGGTLFSISA